MATPFRMDSDAVAALRWVGPRSYAVAGHIVDARSGNGAEQAC